MPVEDVVRVCDVVFNGIHVLSYKEKNMKDTAHRMNLKSNLKVLCLFMLLKCVFL